jgi:hypothetical protein
MATTKPLISVEQLVDRVLSDDFKQRLEALRAVPTGGCNVCRFADPLSDELCTIEDISAEDFDMGYPV